MAGSAAARVTQDNVSAAAEVIEGLAIQGYGVRIEISPKGKTRVFTKSPSDVEIVGPDGRPFPPVPVAANDELPEEIGARLADGWIFGGVSPSTGHPFAWSPEYSFNGQAVQWRQAVAYDPDRAKSGHRDSETIRYVGGSGQFRDKDNNVVTADKDDGGVRTPTREELNMGFENRGAIGGFKRDWHWSSSESNTDSAYAQKFDNGNRLNNHKYYTCLVRCVRSLQRVR